ncbi:MAG: hypothetical protein LBU99_04835 [Spirochaetaceae bacterium]|jgi:ribosomal protein L9|nr:hypothetical protein [Spirochaetaceae bacterium]
MLLFKRNVKESANGIGRKPTKRGRWEEIEEGFVQLEKSMAEIHQAHKLTEMAHRETEKSLAEVHQAHRETEKSLAEVHQAHRETEETLKQSLKELNKTVGGLSNTMGSLVEQFMTAALPGKFRQFGFDFDGIITCKWRKGSGSILTEIDGLLENKTQAMAVEVKTTMHRSDVDDHLKRMERIRMYADERNDKRAFFGAMAGAIIHKDIKEYALSKGFFVIEPSGEDVTVTKPTVEPRRW